MITTTVFSFYSAYTIKEKDFNQYLFSIFILGITEMILMISKMMLIKKWFYGLEFGFAISCCWAIGRVGTWIGT